MQTSTELFHQIGGTPPTLNPDSITSDLDSSIDLRNGCRLSSVSSENDEPSQLEPPFDETGKISVISDCIIAKKQNLVKKKKGTTLVI